MPQLFHIDSKAGQYEGELTRRQECLLTSAMNYHTLVQGGEALCYRVYIGASCQYPRLTDSSTVDGSLTQAVGLTPVCTVKTVAENGNCQGEGDENNSQIADCAVRYIRLPRDDGKVERSSQFSHPDVRMSVRFYGVLERSAPIMFDYVRELLRRYAEQRNSKVITRPSSHTNGMEEVQTVRDSEVSASKWHRPAVIIAMYWLQAGGAERWGMETIRLAIAQGLFPIVITDQESQQPWITNTICDSALILTLTQPEESSSSTDPLLSSLFERYDIRAILIHHNQWMYNRLWWVKRHFPEVHVVDSLHILEYVMQGGYPRQAVLHDGLIDLHHVISPQLEHWLLDRQNIDANKVIDAPLTDLTVDVRKLHYKKRMDARQLTVAFVGRMNRQKRPEAFVLLARKMNRAYPGHFRFILHGSGEMDGYVDKLIERHHLEDVVRHRGESTPVQNTYRDADVLVITSLNEGLTLTTMEAVCSGIPVLSAAVGSQSTLIPPQGLVPRLTASLIRNVGRILSDIDGDEAVRKSLWTAEQQLLYQFSEKESAERLFSRLLAEWSK